MVQISSEKQTIWDDYQPRLADMNKNRHKAKDVAKFCLDYTNLVVERNTKMDAVG